MANDYGLPRQQSPFLDARGEPTTAWYNWLKKLEGLYSGGDAGLQAQITQIAYILGSPDGTVANIPPLNEDFLSSDTIVKGAASVASFGSLSGGLLTLTLVNDTVNPGPSAYYGTDENEALGYWPLPTSGMLPIVTGEIVSGQPVFVIGPDGSLIFGPVI